MRLKENLARFLRAFMEKNRISAAKLQVILDISHNSLYAYLNGTGNPTISTIEYIAEKLNVMPAAIMLGVYDPDCKELSRLLLTTVQGVSELTQEGQQRFALLFIREIMELWTRE